VRRVDLPLFLLGRPSPPLGRSREKRGVEKKIFLVYLVARRSVFLFQYHS
jgi:hypothetical protein